MEGFEIRKWACVNSRTTPTNMQNNGSAGIESPPQDPAVFSFASKHRSAILGSVTRIIDVQGQTPKKRKAALRKSTICERKEKNAALAPIPPLGTRTSNGNASIRRLPLSDKDPNVRNYPVPTKRSTTNPQDSLSNLADNFIEAKSTSAERVPRDQPAKNSNQTPYKSEVDISGIDTVSSTRVQPQHMSNAYGPYNPTDTLSEESKFDVQVPLSSPPSYSSGLEVSDVHTSTNVVASSSPQSASSNTNNGVRPFLRRNIDGTASLGGQSSLPRMLPALRIITCFRIAELPRHLKDQDFLIELYAIAIPIGDSKIRGIQAYKLADLFFPNRPPYLAGSHNTSMGGTGLTSANTLSIEKEFKSLIPSSPSISRNEGEQVVRTIIRPSNSAKSKSLHKTGQSSNNSDSTVDQSGVIAHVHIEAIWESTWEEIRYIRGIVDPDGVAAGRKKD